MSVCMWGPWGVVVTVVCGLGVVGSFASGRHWVVGSVTVRAAVVLHTAAMPPTMPAVRMDSSMEFPVPSSPLVDFKFKFKVSGTWQWPSRPFE